MTINILLFLILGIGLLYDYKKTVLWVACLYPILDMLGGVGPISLMKIFGMMAFVVAVAWHWKELIRCPIFYVAIPYALISIYSNYINERHTPTMLGFISTGVLLPIVFWNAVKTEKRIKMFLKVWTVYMLVVCMYGYIEALTSSNPFALWACDEHNKLFGGYYSAYSDGFRFNVKRIQSLMLCRDACGAFSALFWGLLYYFRTLKREYIDTAWMKYATLALMFMLPVTVLLTGTRACIAMLLVCMISALKKINFNYLVALTFSGIVALIIAEPYLDSIYQSFVDTEKVDGSNLDMRQQQLAAVLMTLRQSPWFGNGFGSWVDYSKWASDLLGAESVWFQLLLKVGILGTITYVVLIILLARSILLSSTPYAVFILLAFLAGLSLSSLPGCDMPLLALFLGMMIRTHNDKDKRTTLNEFRKRLSGISMRSSI